MPLPSARSYTPVTLTGPAALPGMPAQLKVSGAWVLGRVKVKSGGVLQDVKAVTKKTA